MRISDWSSDVCSSDLQPEYRSRFGPGYADAPDKGGYLRSPGGMALRHGRIDGDLRTTPPFPDRGLRTGAWCGLERTDGRVLWCCRRLFLLHRRSEERRGGEE